MSKDIDFRFKLHPITGDLVLKKDEDAIKQSLRSIIMHNPGERRLDSDFGGGIYQLMFENLDIFQTEFVRKRLISNITIYEKRIQIVDLQVRELPNSNALFVDLQYKLKNGGGVQNFSVTLERTL